MVVASYYGGNLDDPEIDYTNWNEWISAIREDFRKFIDYRLCDISNSEKLIKELQEDFLVLICSNNTLFYY